MRRELNPSRLVCCLAVLAVFVLTVLITTLRAEGLPDAATQLASNAGKAASRSGLSQARYPAHWARLVGGVNIATRDFPTMKRADFRYLRSIGLRNIRLNIIPYDSKQMKPGDKFDPTAPYVQDVKRLMDMALKEDLA